MTTLDKKKITQVLVFKNFPMTNIRSIQEHESKKIDLLVENKLDN